MIEVDAIFTVQSVKDMGKNKRISNYIIFPLLAAAMIAGGIVSLVRNAGVGENAMGIILLVLGPIVLFLTFYMTISETKNNLKAFGVIYGDVHMNYKFGSDGVVITRDAFGKTDRDTIYYKELYKVKRTKKAFMLYMNKDEMFYVPAEEKDFVSGTADRLFKLFYDNKVILDYLG